MNNVSSISYSPSRPVPVADILPWAVFSGILLLIAVYFVGTEQGATALLAGNQVHEFVHDARHLLGFPCH